jgi:co-chaperonin GroES (HSP10)
MKTITTILTAVAVSFSLNVSADLYNDPGMGDVFPMENIQLKEQQRTPYIVDTGKQVYYEKYEEWINPADFNVTTEVITVADILRELETNPPASNGMSSDPVFIFDETAGEYQFQ